MTASTVHTGPSNDTNSNFERACRLIETELGGRRLPPEPRTWLDDLARTRRHKTALITAVWNNCFPSGVVEACRVVEAIYPYLDADGRCTDAAVTAAWNILEPDAHTWPEHLQDQRRYFTGKCLNRALAEANSTVTDHA
ncbi:hypothetical protein Amsp01_090280 [Amycolatopsis sp. NBRC 101858]|uniref:hypothetical protein n=1 Tax=Amycolatopsis sp. NBRC 101858 TaxID=3032200 RepID=UPI0024A07050|nr:hypothetical protein [Amycolatopsis sp. NBRC 101858]GLY43005.1 hypothetical protein Amsp01_090280 [Amycolatopsis sp. NBRC 101858]